MNYFDFYYDKGETWYRSMLPTSGSASIGEATPNYLHDSDAPARLAEVAPDAKLLVILRDPVARAYSHYWHEVERGRENLSFVDAISAEEGRLESATRQERAHVSYVSKGRYADQLDRWLEHFERPQLHIVLMEHLRSQPAQVAIELQHFLGVTEEPMPSLGVSANRYLHFRSLYLRNRAKKLPSPFDKIVGRLNAVKSSYPPLSPQLRSALRLKFEDSDARLKNEYGVDIPW